MGLPFYPQPKSKSRLEDKAAAKKLELVDDKAFRLAVWKRDGGKCRMCGRKVSKTISRVPERGEVHHIHGRTGDLRHEVRAALLLCLRDHERVTGKVNIKLVIVATKEFVIRQGRFIDATHKVLFQEIP